MTNTESPEASSATSRAIAILEWVAQAQGPVAVAELVRQLQLPKPSAHRICGSLEQMGLLRREPAGNGLLVGHRLLRLSLNAAMNFADRGSRRAILRSLMEETGETCTLTVPDGDELVVLERVESPAPLTVQLRPGSRAPLHCTASGKLFLGMLPPTQRRKILDSLPLRPYTERTITEVSRLSAHLELVRKNGYATDDEEFAVGLRALAVPVLGKRRRVIAGLSINAPAARLNVEDAIDRVPLLRHAAGRIAQTILGD